MSTDRVDKKWVDRGIESYSTEAILGTLGHYGVQVTEAQYLELAKDLYPLSIAEGWHSSWKGTGQFTRFPAAAAEELWTRLKPGEIAPTDLALALIKLLQMLDEVLDGKADDGTRDTRFKVVEAYAPKLPTDPDRRLAFVAEMMAAVGEWAEVFDEMPEALVKKNELAWAERLVGVDELIFPEHVGITRSAVKLAKGDVEGALTDYAAIAADTSRVPLARLGALDALIEHKKYDPAVKPLLELLDRAEAERDVDLASDAVGLLGRLLELAPNRKDLDGVRERVEKLIARFNADAEEED